MPQNTITFSSNQLFWLCVFALIAFVIVVCTAIISLWNKEKVLHELVKNEFLFLRIITILFIVWSTTVLALLGALNAGVTAIFGGIVGYLLGSIRGVKQAAKVVEEEDT